ncbi:MAG: glycosyltransferase family 2 protein [Candidatus Eisenbacteria bacterium]
MTSSQVAPLLSALVITRDESGNIDRCLSALSFCDEIVLVDSESRDDTVARARRYTDRVWVEPWRGYSGQKRFALEKTRGRWVLWVDADEVVQPELAHAIRSAVESEATRLAGYRLRRRVNYLGRWIRFGSFGRDWVLRLFLRDRASFTDALVHEGVRVDGPIGQLPGCLEHWSYRDQAHHRAKIEAMSALWAEQEAARGRRVGPGEATLRAFVRYVRLLLLEGGFLNGAVGWTIARMGAVYVKRKYELLAERTRNAAR